MEEKSNQEYSSLQQKSESQGGWVSRLVPASSGKAELKQASDESSHEGNGIN